MGIVFCKNSFIGELFWHFQIYGYDFPPDLWVYFGEISPDLWVLLLRFEWHHPVSWKLKLPSPPPGFGTHESLLVKKKSYQICFAWITKTLLLLLFSEQVVAPYIVL